VSACRGFISIIICVTSSIVTAAAVRDGQEKLEIEPLKLWSTFYDQFNRQGGAPGVCMSCAWVVRAGDRRHRFSVFL
jgi:hypothetical protein